MNHANDVERQVHQARLDRIFHLLPCFLGKPKLTFNPTPDSYGEYCLVNNAINLDVFSDKDLRPFKKDDFWTMSLAHEYAHAYLPTTFRENLAFRERGPAYIQHETEMDKLAAVIILALAGEEGFPERERVKGLIAGWNGMRGQHYAEVWRIWGARMRKEYPPLAV